MSKVTYKAAKREAGLTDAEVAEALRAELGDVRGISIHSVSLWSRGMRLPPWWAQAALARALRIRNFSGFSLERRRARKVPSGA